MSCPSKHTLDLLVQICIPRRLWSCTRSEFAPLCLMLWSPLQPKLPLIKPGLIVGMDSYQKSQAKDNPMLTTLYSRQSYFYDHTQKTGKDQCHGSWISLSKLKGKNLTDGVPIELDLNVCITSLSWNLLIYYNSILSCWNQLNVDYGIRSRGLFFLL